MKQRSRGENVLLFIVAALNQCLSMLLARIDEMNEK